MSIVLEEEAAKKFAGELNDSLRILRLKIREYDDEFPIDAMMHETGLIKATNRITASLAPEFWEEFKVYANSNFNAEIARIHTEL